MPGRARSLEEMKAQPPLFTKEGHEAGLAIALRPTDVVISPFGKSGTTWTQQIVHTLRTRGDMDFDDISRVVPWIEVSTDLGIDLNAEQRANPRAFKSHLAWDEIPKGGRYIVVVRDPGDAAVSAFKFAEGWFLEPGAIAIDEYVTQGFLKRREYYRHLSSWWAHRHDDNVLLLAYEHMLENSEKAIEHIAEFIGIELDAELKAITLAHTSMAFMLEHKDRFDDALIRRRSEEVLGLPSGSDSAKVRLGQAGTRVALAPATLSLLAQAWQEEIANALGLADYQALLDALT